MEIKVRKLQPRDRGVIKRLLEGIPQFIDEEKKCTVELMDISLGSEPDARDYEFLVAVDGEDTPCGFICFGDIPLTDGCYDLYWIVCDPLLQNRGVGTKLLNGLEEILKARRARKLFAETSSQEGYTAAHNFYKKRNFKQIAQIPDFYKPGDDKLIYVKTLISV